MSKFINITWIAVACALVISCGKNLPFAGDSSDGDSGESASSSPTPSPAASQASSPRQLAIPDTLENLNVCRTVGGTTSISKTSEVINLINALLTARNAPVSLPCLVAALPRPLKLSGVDSAVSAQPSAGPTNPRVFIQFGTMYLSVVSEGIGAGLLEFSEFIAPPDSVKGELKFPIEKTLDPAAPFTRIEIAIGEGRTATGCSNCHANERKAGLPNFPEAAFLSKAIKPKPSQLLPLSVLSRLDAECYAGGEYRCGLYKSFFLGERPVLFSFPDDMPIFF